MTDEGSKIEALQDAIGVTDEEVCARAKRSTKTLRRAKLGKAPAKTQNKFLDALEQLRLESIDRLSSMSCKAVS